MTWREDAGLLALALVVGGAFYIQLRWRRAPQAYRAISVVAGVYLIAGGLLGGSLVHSSTRAPSSDRIAAIAPDSAALPAVPGLSPISAKVTSITDGDTVDVIESNGTPESVRLIGIDAPEHGQAFATESTQHLSNLISNKSVELHCGEERSYERLLCKVLLPNQEDVDLDQVKAGMAWHYKQYQDEQSAEDRAKYATEECAAMKARLGLWSDPHPVQPQDFRHSTNSPLLYDGNGCRTSSEPSSGAVVGNIRSHIFEWPACPSYSAISDANRVSFSSPQAAESAGYRPAHSCP